MADGSAYIRCSSCSALNRVPSHRLTERPLCGKCKRPLDFPTRPVDATEQSFAREVFDWPGVAIVEFWSTRCGACALIAPQLEGIASRKAGLVKVVRINIEKELSVANRFQIRSTPTLMVYRNGELVDELYGALPEPEMRAWLEAAAKR